jgi:tripartite-type tricarboxylate transporter receptor subunit TctC
MIGVTGSFAPVKTPGAIISRLNREIVRVLSLPDVKERFLNAGVEVVGCSSEELAATMKSDPVRISKLIKDAGIKVD